MHLRAAIAVMIVGVAGCNMRPIGFPPAHIRVTPGVEGREQVYQIGKQLSGFGPIILLEEQRGVANIVLAKRAPAQVIGEAARKVNAHVFPGLDKPSAAFMRQTRCASNRPCDVTVDTACEFAAEVSPGDHARYFGAYAQRLAYGGYAILAVLHKQEDTQKIIIRVPMYDHCSSGAKQLEKAWESVSSKKGLSFTNTSARSSTR